MDKEHKPKHRVFPEGFDTRRGRALNDEQRWQRERHFREARQRRQMEDATAIAAVLQEIHGPHSPDTSAYLDRIFPAFENLSPTQQHLIASVLDPERLKHPVRLDHADDSFTRGLRGELPRTWHSRWVELTSLFMYDVNGDGNYAKYFGELRKRHPAEKVLYAGSGFDRSVSDAFGRDHVVNLSSEDHYFQSKHVEHDFDTHQPDIDVTGDVRDLPFRSDAFDLTVLKHLHPGALLANDEQGIAEVIRTLRPGGKIFYAHNVIDVDRDELALDALRPHVKFLERFRWIDVFEKAE